jgi:hypothetical protein
MRPVIRQSGIGVAHWWYLADHQPPCRSQACTGHT